jgi:hypothetical protein
MPNFSILCQMQWKAKKRHKTKIERALIQRLNL